MSSSILAKLITQDNIRKTWKAFWRDASKQRSSGVDNVTPAAFFASEERNLARLKMQLHAGYVFAPLRGHLIPKKDGATYRIICVPTVQDRIVQRLLADHLTREADRLGIINEVSYGFIPSAGDRKRGVQAARDRAIALRTQHGWAYKSDITSFFDQIPRAELVSKTVGSLRARSLRPLLLAAASCEIENSRSIGRIAANNGIQRGRGIRQGMPLSPLFANIILRDFDREMVRRGKRMVRYADDFIVFADSREECVESDRLARRLLSRLDFTLPPLDKDDSKTFIAAPNEEVEFLGLALVPDHDGSYRLILTERQLEKIRRDFSQLTDVTQLLAQGIHITDLANTVENKVGGYLAAYKNAQNIDCLRAILDQSRSMIMRSVYVKAFGEEKVRALDESMRRFLGLESISQPKRRQRQDADLSSRRIGPDSGDGAMNADHRIQGTSRVPQRALVRPHQSLHSAIAKT